MSLCLNPDCLATNPDLLRVRLSVTPQGIDYTKLEELLRQQKWKEADQETYVCMITAYYNSLEFSLSAPPGQLPAWVGWTVLVMEGWGWVGGLLSRKDL